MPDGSRSFAQAAAPDLERVERLFRAHLAFVWRVLRRCGVPPAELDDAVQETFLVVHRRIGDFEGRASERTWLYAVAVRVASTLRRSAARERARRERVGEQMHSTSDADPEDELARGEAAQLLDGLLDELDDTKRVVFVLAELEGVKVPEIARILDVNVRTVHSRLRLGRERFSAALARHRAREEGHLRRAALRDLRRASQDDTPSQQRASAAWTGLAVRISDGAAAMPIVWKGIGIAAAAKGTSFLLPFVATVAIGTAGVALVASQTHAQSAAAAAPPRAMARAVAAPSAPPAIDAPAARAEPATVPVTAGITATPAPADAATPPRGDVSPPPRSPPTAAPPPAPAAVPKTAPDLLLAETTLLAHARAALKAGQHRNALRLLSDHAKAFPTGTLAAERDSSRIKAHCALGEAAKAKELAKYGPEGLQSVFEAHCPSAGAKAPRRAQPATPPTSPTLD